MLKSFTSCKYIAFVLQKPVIDGKMPVPSLADTARWAMEATEAIPRRTIVRSFVACRVTRPEDYSEEERRTFGLDELVHMSVVRAMANLLDDEPELKAQLEDMSDTDDDEWLYDVRTPHVPVGDEAEEAEGAEEVVEDEEMERADDSNPNPNPNSSPNPSPNPNQGAERAEEAEGEEDDNEDDEDDEDDEGQEQEVLAEQLVTTFMPYASLVGSDVCVLSAAYPDTPLREEGAVGWRAQVARKRGGGADLQVQVFGSWFLLHDAERISPVVQGEAEGGEEEEGERELDSSDDEVPVLQKKARVH